MNDPREKIVTRVLYYLLLFIVRNKWVPIGILLGCVVLAGQQLPNLTFDNTPDGFFMEGDPNLVNYEQFKDRFESDEFSLVLLDAPALWDKSFIDAIRQAVAAFKQLEHVKRVVSITNVRNIEGSGDEILIEDFFQGVISARDIADKQQKAVAHPHYSGFYVSKDGHHVAILVETEIIKGQMDYKIGLTKSLRRIAGEGPLAAYNPRVVGAHVLDADVRTMVEKESGMFSAICFALIMLGFWVVFRSLYAMLMAFVILICSLLMTFGLMSGLGYPFTLLTPIVPSFLMSVGIGSLVFLLSAFCHNREQGLTVDDALITTFTEVGAISFMTVLTTAAALFTFSFSKIVPVFEVGIIMGAGLLIIFVLTLVLFPIFIGSKSHRFLRLGGSTLNKRVTMLTSVGEWVILHYRLLLCGFVMVSGLAGMGLMQLKTDYHYLGIFKPSTRIHQEYTAVDNLLPASAALELVLRGNRENAVKQPTVLQAMDQLATYITENSKLPVKVYSLADVVKELNKAFHNNDATFYTIPDSADLIAQELLLFESSDQDEVKQLVDMKYQQARVTIRVPNVADSQYRDLLALIDQGIQNYFDGNAKAATMVGVDSPEAAGLRDVRVMKTGLVQLWVTISDYLTESQISSVTLSFIAVAVVMVLIFRSIVMGLLLGLLNLSVVIMVLGVMGAVGVYLDPYTILIAAIALGILDDDTMHFVKSVQEDVLRGFSIENGIRNTYAQAGQAIFYTTAVLVISFATYVFSSIASLTKFGLLLSLTLALGLIIEFLITPAIILLVGKYIFKPANNASVRLGETVTGY